MNLSVTYFLVLMDYLSSSSCYNTEKVMGKENQGHMSINYYAENKIKMRHYNTDNDLKNKSESLLLYPMDEKDMDMINSIIGDDVNIDIDVIPHISKEGCPKLTYLASEIRTHLNLTTDYYIELRNVTENYVAELNAYSSFIRQQKVENEIEQFFYYLDIVQSSYDILFSACKMLTDLIITHANIKLNDTAQFSLETSGITEKIQKVVTSEKKNTLRYVCQKVNICKSYPAYFDRTTQLLDEILKFTDSKIDIVVTVSLQILKAKALMLTTVIDEDIANVIVSELGSILDYYPSSREFLSVLRENSVQRYKTLTTKDGDVAIKAKATMILVDMIERTVELLDDDLIEVQLHKVIKDLKRWDVSNVGDISKIMAKYFYDIENTLHIYWLADTKNEVKYLIHVIMTGTYPESPGEDLKYLFTRGSNFIRRQIAFSKWGQLFYW